MTMPQVTFIEADGTERLVDAPEGASLMSAAVKNNVRGIDAECGGGMSCATCHVYVDAEWIDRVGTIDGDERELASFCDGFDESCSRLSCQITIAAGLDGLKVRIPSS